MTRPDHERFMRRCLQLAPQGRNPGNTPGGSVVVLDGTGRKDRAGAVLYTTAEPCFMCGYAIRQLRVGLVVYGMDTPVIGSVTSIHPILTDPALDGWRPAPTVIGGVLLEECQ